MPQPAVPEAPRGTALQALRGYQWVEPILGRVIHHTPALGPPPQLLCKQKESDQQKFLETAYEHHDGHEAAARTGKHCCGQCWQLLPPMVAEPSSK